MGSPPDALDVGGVGPGPSFGPALLIARAHIAWAIGLVVATVVVVVLGRVVLDAASASARVEELRAANAELRAQVDALVAERRLVTSEIFVQVAGRARGYGEPTDRAFGMVPGGPPPAPLLVEEDSTTEELSPLEAWLALLFGP